MTITKAGTDTRNLLFLSRGAAPVAAYQNNQSKTLGS